MTKEVHIYISLFVVMLGYLFYMDYQGKTIARPTGEIISNAISIPYGVPQLSARERDALKNPKEGTLIYFMGDEESLPGFQIFYKSEAAKELGLPPAWTRIDDPILQAEEKEKMLNARDYLLHLEKSVPHVSPFDIKNPVEGMIIYREELSPLANEEHIPSLHELILPFVIYANGIWQEISLGDLEEPEKTKETISGDICVTAEDLGKITKYDMDTNADQIKVPPRRILCPVCGETTFLCPEHCGNSPCVHGASGEKHKLGCLLSLSSKELAGLKKYYEENK